MHKQWVFSQMYVNANICICMYFYYVCIKSIMYVYVSNLSYARAEKFKLFIKGYILFFIGSIKVFYFSNAV